MSSIHTRFILVSAMLALSGCAATSSQAVADQSEGLSDANIAAIVVGANKIDISAAQIALERSSNRGITEFAERMVTDHGAVLESAVALVSELGVTPVDNDLVATLAEQSSKHEQTLRSLSGPDFDKSYIDHEVVYHEAVIGVVKEQLIPAAQNARLKEALISVLPAFQAHLESSRMLQSQIQ
jgi:putative membrane protein